MFPGRLGSHLPSALAGAVMQEDVHVAEGHQPAQRARLDTLDVIIVAENAGNGLWFVPAAVADRVADQIDRPPLQGRRGIGGEGQWRVFAVVLRRFHLQKGQVVPVMDAEHALDSVGGQTGRWYSAW